MTYGNNTYAQTLLTPSAPGISYYWSQEIFPTTVGTVYIIVNDHNQTKTVTSTNSAAIASNTQFLRNGSLVLLTRTDVNDAGTVTTTLSLGPNHTTVLTYPTPYFTVQSPISWSGLFAGPIDSTTCCHRSWTTSAIPSHYPFPSSTGSTNPADPSGWLYNVTTSQPWFIGAQKLSSLLAPAMITSVTQSCPHPLCPSSASVEAASAVQAVGALLATTTVHVTGTFSTTATPAAHASPESAASVSPESSSSVEVDPLTAGATASTVAASSATQQASTSSDAAVSSVSQASTLELGSNGGATQPSSSPEIAQPTAISSNVVPPAESAVSATTQQPSATHGSAATQNQPTQGEAPAASSDSIDTARSTTEASPSASSDDQGPASTAQSSAENIAGTIASLLGQHTTVTITSSQGSSTVSSSVAPLGPTFEALSILLAASGSASAPTAGPESNAQSSTVSSDALPAPLFVGSTSVSLQNIGIGTTISGSTIIVPGVVVGSQTVPLGSTVSVGSTAVAIFTSGSQTYALIGESTSPLAQHTVAPSSSLGEPRPIVVGGTTVSANSASEYIISGQTLVLGSSVTVGNGASTTVIGLQTAGSQTALLIGSSTSQIGASPFSAPGPVTPAPIVIGSSTVSADSASQYVVSGQTLVPGASITIGSGASTTVIELRTSGSQTALVIGTSTSPIGAPSPAIPASLTLAPITIGGSVIIPNSNSEYMIGSQILSPGSVVTVSGTTYSLAPSATELIVGTSTEALVSEASLGGYIWSGVAGGSATTSSGSIGQLATSGSNTVPATESPGASSVPVGAGTTGTQSSSQSAATPGKRSCRMLMIGLALLLVLQV